MIHVKKKVYACAIRGRSEGDWHTTAHRQVLEVGDDICNSITSVEKDSLILEVYDEENHTTAKRL